MNQSNTWSPSRWNTITWLPRVFSGMVVLSIGGFMLAYFLGGEEVAARPLAQSDMIGLGALITSLIGLAAAWKWECFGAILTLASVAVGFAYNWQVITFPLVLIPIAAVSISCLRMVATQRRTIFLKGAALAFTRTRRGRRQIYSADSIPATYPAGS